MARRGLVMIGLLALIGAAPAAPQDYRSVLIKGVPHIEQRPDFCGEACVAMALRHRGLRYRQEAVFDAAAIDPELGRGAYAPELVRALQSIGFEVGEVWHEIASADAPRQLEARWAELHADLGRGIPSIVCMHYDDTPGSPEHFRLALGYDADADALIYHEPAEAKGAYRRMPRAQFLKLWPLKYKPATWTVIRARLAPKALRAPAKAAGRTTADYAQHVLALRQRLPEGFTVVVQPPFVVIGDEAPALVQRRAEGTVQWAVERLKRDYFTRDPKEILDIWLFKDRASYRHHTASLFKHKPETPFGYFSEDVGALIMNIETGGGTLVHEIVHPFMDANFPNCPAWFNEGLGSLYEQSTDRDGHIWGLTNWRLPDLQETVRAGGLPSIRQLTRMSDADFYADETGTHYAMARYLLYYLQQEGKLVAFYRRFHRDRASDPSGFRSLRRVLGVEDMAAFQRVWEAHVLGLRFPPST